MLRRSSLFLLAALAGVAGLPASPVTASAASAASAGAPCPSSSVGRTSGRLVCTREGSRTVWRTRATTTRPATTSSPVTKSAGADASEPKRGGKLVFALESDTAGWTPQQAVWSTSSQTVRFTMIESLTQPDPDGNWRCYLCESMTPNSTYTEWTVKLRRGISFHNGEPFDAAAVKLNLDQGRRPGSNNASALRGIAEVEVVDAHTLVISTSMPWVSMPASLAQTGGAMVAPAQLRDPNGRTRPIGTGPFKFKEWVVNDHLTVVRNDGYWRKGLPYLDEITFRPVPEESARITALQSGAIDGMHTADGNKIAELRKLSGEGKVGLTEFSKWPGVNIITLSNLTGATADARVRKAMLLATDRAEWNKVANAGVLRLADAPFGPGTVDLAKAVWPQPDPAKAKALIEEVEKDTGEPVEITFSAQATPDVLEAAQVVQSQWQRAGMRVRVLPVEPTQYSTQTSTGRLQAGFQRWPSVTDPDELRRYLHSENASPIGVPGGNYGRVRSAIIDAAFDQIRSNPDPAVRKRSADAITRELVNEAYVILTSQTLWAVAVSPKIGLATPQNPDGSTHYAAPTGAVQLAYAYRR